MNIFFDYQKHHIVKRGMKSMEKFFHLCHVILKEERSF